MELNQASPLDFVAQACMDLTETLSSITNENERNHVIISHIKKVWSAVPSIDDFQKNLEWVNVSEPISLSQHCSEKVVLLDFWTYCCINCYHVLPDLAYLESQFKVENGFVVIGVHCAKFSNEKNSSNVLAAVKRYAIQHPVVNDYDCTMWDALSIQCWPTLLILGPGNKPLFVLTGEGHRQELEWFVKAALKHFDTQISQSTLPVSLDKHIEAKSEGTLLFPGKLALNPFYRGRNAEPYLAIADTGHHRVLLTDSSGGILRVFGGPEPGFKDGKSKVARMSSPQGVCWLSSSVLAVCDTGNHAVRAIHLDDDNVELLAGTGEQSARGDLGGKVMGQQALSSPWDILVYTTPDMDLSVRAPSSATHSISSELTGEEKKDDKRRVLVIACAGSHQIWGLFLDTTIWWKYKTFTEGTCVCIAGSGQEAARNSAYPQTAAFAQPSGLALRSGTCPEVMIADSESSSIRRLSLATGTVSTLCGGDRNPLNLFAFGDVDDVGVEAKLQHPMGVAYSNSSRTLYVADTYNNKIKRVDISIQKVTTLTPIMVDSNDQRVQDTSVFAEFNEPSGLALSGDDKHLFVADTNNHSIKVINLVKNTCQEFALRLPEVKFVEPDNLILYKNDLFINRKCGHLIIFFGVTLETTSKAVEFAPNAPQNWSICIRDDDSNDVTEKEFEFVNCSRKGTVIPSRVEMKLKHKTDKTHYKMYMSFKTALCQSGTCFSHSFMIRSTILVRDSVKMTESYKITCKVNPSSKFDKAKQTSEQTKL